jgi:hypothetical protein
MNWETVSKKIDSYNWVTLFILGVMSFFLANADMTLGIILGGLLIIANFNVLEHTIRGAFDRNGAMKAKKKSIILKYYLRLGVMGILIYLLITKGWVNPIGLVIGLSTVVISITIMGIHLLLKQSTWETI